ncbi:hypothetical protein CDL12_12880 [Handroanthus impetiginosus]|uniref:S-protein homolog n=1 Tax=Handroanthus impetiginosus TaxID=429701 RepID=A0A2G9HAE9_9LAMI|nr:hypothetical protein CDL12_12880 [Handroanthus impetiginosus]
MDINIISKMLVIVFVLSFNLVDVARTLSLNKKYEVHIENDLPEDDPNPLLVHCASKDNEIINGTIPRDKEIYWHFHMNLFSRTVYFCHFWWGSRNKAFEVFNRKLRQFCEDDGYILQLISWLKVYFAFGYNNYVAFATNMN